MTSWGNRYCNPALQFWAYGCAAAFLGMKSSVCPFADAGSRLGSVPVNAGTPTRAAAGKEVDARVDQYAAGSSLKPVGDDLGFSGAPLLKPKRFWLPKLFSMGAP